MFKEGKYTVKEAAIIATGFSTVSVTFMVVVAKTLGLMPIWNTYFWVTFLVTFAVTALTARLWPLSRMSDEYYEGKGDPEQKVTGSYMKQAWSEAMKAVGQSKGIGTNIWENLRDGFIMTMGILPSIMSVGLIGLLLAEYTPLFDWLGYLFYPFTLLLQIPEPLLAAIFRFAAIPSTRLRSFSAMKAYPPPRQAFTAFPAAALTNRESLSIAPPLSSASARFPSPLPAFSPVHTAC